MSIKLGGTTEETGASTSINLSKGERISLTKTAPGLKKITVGLGWDVQTGQGADFDLDAEALLVKGANAEMVYYHETASSNGSVQHSGDNRTGNSDGDDETIKVDLDAVPGDVERIIFTVTIHEAQERGQNFGQVNNAYIRLVDESTQKEIIRYDLSEDYSTSISIIVGELYRHNGEWKFNAKGEGRVQDLGALCQAFGVR